MGAARHRHNPGTHLLGVRRFFTFTLFHSFGATKSLRPFALLLLPFAITLATFINYGILTLKKDENGLKDN